MLSWARKRKTVIVHDPCIAWYRQGSDSKVVAISGSDFHASQALMMLITYGDRSIPGTVSSRVLWRSPGGDLSVEVNSTSNGIT
jgi:hypothetical protein